MPRFYKPHSSEWFAALIKANPQQAQHTAQIIKLSGKKEVCSICGDDDYKDYEILEMEYGPGVVASIRLCDDCKMIRESGLAESYIPLGDEENDKN